MPQWDRKREYTCLDSCQARKRISLVAEKSNYPEENKSHKEEKELDALISREDEREQSKGVEAVVTRSKARVLEKGQKENQKTDKSVIPKKQDNVQWLYPAKEVGFNKLGTSDLLAPRIELLQANPNFDSGTGETDFATAAVLAVSNS
uniref:Uncharacterized protein n=1 Tax=Romanomermis culicivorax TaxID=13658 RepID=A0A915LAL6_ROMCU